MKKKLICILALTLCVITALLCLASCGSSDGKKSALVGTWAANEAEGMSYVFNEDGTGKWDAGDYAMNFTYTEKDGVIELTYDGATTAQKWEYTIDGSTLTMKETDSGTTLTYTKK